MVGHQILLCANKFQSVFSMSGSFHVLSKRGASADHKSVRGLRTCRWGQWGSCWTLCRTGLWDRSGGPPNRRRSFAGWGFGRSGSATACCGSVRVEAILPSFTKTEAFMRWILVYSKATRKTRLLPGIKVADASSHRCAGCSKKFLKVLQQLASKLRKPRGVIGSGPR